MHQQGRRQRGSQAVWLVQLARPFSALTAGLRTRVLLRHCVLVRPVTRVVPTTICAVRSQTLIVLVLGLNARPLVSLPARGNGCSKQHLVALVLPVLLLGRRVRLGMGTVRSRCILTVQARGLSVLVRARLQALDSGHRQQRQPATD